MKPLVVLISAIIILLSLTACTGSDTEYYTAEDLGIITESTSDSDITSEDSSDDTDASSAMPSDPSTDSASKINSSESASNIFSSAEVNSTDVVEDKVVYYKAPEVKTPAQPKRPEYKPAEISGEKLDGGKCGDTLYWDLYSNGTLHIHGSGKMYDYVKYDAVRQSPWYKYRAEPLINDKGTMFLNPDGTEYVSVESYNKSNPNGWKIKDIRIDPGVTYIGNWAFYRVCVEHLEIPEGVTETGYFAIRFSPTLKSVGLPNSLVLLDDLGISRNQVLETIYFGNSLKTLGLAALNNNDSLKTAILPNSVTEINKRQHDTYDAHENQANTVGLFESCDSLENVSLGNANKVPQRTFLNCKSLQSVVIPKSAVSIDEYAFAGCSALKTVAFEEGSECKKIVSKAFFNCSAIEYFFGCTALEIIEENSFNHSGMTNLKLFEFSDMNKSFQNGLFANSKIVTAKIGANVERLSNDMFNKSAIQELYISSGVKEFGSRAFSGCEDLNNIYFEGTRDDWNKIAKGSNFAYMTPDKNNSATVHFSDGATEKLKNILK